QLCGAEIECIIDDALDNCRAMLAKDADLHSGVLLFEIGEDAGKDIQTRRFTRADGQFTLGRGSHFADFFLSPAAQVENLARVFSEAATRSREGDSGGHAI